MRRHDLDWLRVIAFGLLIFYHAGMFFVPWGFHIKNNQIYHWLIYPMLFLNQWRLPLLFMISGMGTFFAFRKLNGRQFAVERLKRLLIPLVMGMLVIVPPQVYIERIAKGQFAGSYFDFWPSQLFARGAYPQGNLSWHHLWFLPYLLLFSLLLIPVFTRIRKKPGNRLSAWMTTTIAKPFGIYLLIAPLYFIEAFIEPFFPVTHALTGDWFTIINTCTLFFYGYLLMSARDAFWSSVTEKRKQNLVIAILAFALLMYREIFLQDSYLVHFTEAFVKVVNFWAWLLVLFGFGSVYLNKPGKFLSYANEAVYPFYILHQSVMLVICYFFMDKPYGFYIKFPAIAAGTFAGTWIIYELLVRRWKWARLLFGMKVNSKDSPQPDVIAPRLINQ